MKTTNGMQATAAASLVLLALAGCGGDDGGGNNAVTTPPVTTPPVATVPTLTTAAASIEGLLAYMKLAIASFNDTGEPIDVTTFVAPTSETIEPDSSV